MKCEVFQAAKACEDSDFASSEPNDAVLYRPGSTLKLYQREPASAQQQELKATIHTKQLSYQHRKVHRKNLWSLTFATHHTNGTTRWLMHRLGSIRLLLGTSFSKGRAPVLSFQTNAYKQSLLASCNRTGFRRRNGGNMKRTTWHSV